MSWVKESHLRRTFAELESATDNFRTFIGKGGFGEVYKGELSISGVITTVAVKRLDSKLTGQGLKEFLTEIQLLSGYKHQNLISLLGFCDEGKEKLLVYEYAEHGSLDRYLSTTNTSGNLTWLQRLEICVGAARGLEYLHHKVGEHHRVIHRDIKSANILLDHNWEAKIADLGLSKLGIANDNNSFLISNACGTQGYCDPVYISTGVLKKESDVYSFGVVLLEVMCGRLCFISSNGDRRSLVPLAQWCYRNKKMDEVVDPVLRKQMDSNSLKTFADIAYQCVLLDQEQRPSMTVVLKKLKEALEFQLQQKLKDLSELSLEELKAYDGRDPKKPLLMAIKGQIYDVSESRIFYGPGGPYAVFAGKDASRALAMMSKHASIALAMMSLEEKDLNGDLTGLGEFELEALADFEYKYLSKYVKVGTIIKHETAPEASTTDEPAESSEAKPV